VPGGVASGLAMIDGPLRRLFWRVVDALDYLLTLAWLRILDALAGTLSETPTDQRCDVSVEGAPEPRPDST
jgi:hypothetical protein